MADKVIVYRNKFEQDADEFWHSETGTYLILVIAAIVLGAVVYAMIKDRKSRRFR